jgi:periplasmic protein TonB
VPSSPDRAGAALVAIAAILVALGGLAAGARAQSGEIVRGRPSIPDQDARRKSDAPADADSLGDDLAESPESAPPLIDEPGAPRARTRIAPRYPDAALRAGIQGTVVLVVRIAPDGSVPGSRVLESIPKLDRAAMDAVRGWTFEPVRIKGKPVDAQVTVPIRFLLPPDRAFDWRAARATGAASEQAGRMVDAFEHYLAGFRNAAADSAADAEGIRDDLLRVAPRLPAKGADARIVPVEARIELDRGESLLTAARTPGEAAAATAAFARATGWAPWHAPAYRRLAAAQEKMGDRSGAAVSLARALAADPQAPDREQVNAAIARLRATATASPR